MAVKQPDLPQFEKQKRQAQQRARAAGQEASSAIKRRFAALGGISGGAAIKQEALAKGRAQEIGERAVSQIDLAQEAERRRRQEITEGREFTAGEALKGREFAAEQAGIGREFGAEQARIGREFGAKQAGIGREFTAEQSNIQRSFLARESAEDRQERKYNARNQLDLAQKSFDLEKDALEFNKQIALWEQGQGTDMFGSLIPGLGGKSLTDIAFNPFGTAFDVAEGLGIPGAGTVGGVYDSTFGSIF